MSKDRWVVYWNPGSPEVAVLPWPDIRDAGRGYACSDFDCWSHVREMDAGQRWRYALDLMVKVISDGCYFPGIGDEFMKISDLREVSDKVVGQFGRNKPTRH